MTLFSFTYQVKTKTDILPGKFTITLTDTTLTSYVNLLDPVP